MIWNILKYEFWRNKTILMTSVESFNQLKFLDIGFWWNSIIMFMYYYKLLFSGT